MNDPFELREWSPEELDLMFTKRLKPLQDEIANLRKENERLQKSIADTHNQLQDRILLNTTGGY
jgi:uncharacterized protein YdcH (DUF465 family)